MLPNVAYSTWHIKQKQALSVTCFIPTLDQLTLNVYKAGSGQAGLDSVVIRLPTFM